MAISPNSDRITEYVQSDLDGEVAMLSFLELESTRVSGDESGQNTHVPSPAAMRSRR